MITIREDSFKTKEKGKKLELKVRDLLRSYVSEPSLIQSQNLSAHGEDIIIDPMPVVNASLSRPFDTRTDTYHQILLDWPVHILANYLNRKEHSGQY